MANLFIDLDGTILDVSEKYYRIYREFMIEHAKKYLDKEKFWRLKRRRKHHSMDVKDAQLRNVYKRYFAERVEREDCLLDDKIFPFSIPVLRLLREKGNTIYIFTMRQNRKNLMAQMKSFELHDEAKIICAPKVQDKRTQHFQIKADLIKHIARMGDTVIGDTEADVLCGKELGIQTVGVLSGISNYKALRLSSPDRIIRDLRTLVFI